MSRNVVTSEKLPKAVGPYNHAIISNGFVFTSGQLPINPTTNKVETSDFEGQLRQSLDNLSALLESAGTSLKNIVKITVFLIDLTNFPVLNKVFMEYFPENAPARSAFQVSRLPLDVQVEIEAVAVVEI